MGGKHQHHFGGKGASHSHCTIFVRVYTCIYVLICSLHFYFPLFFHFFTALAASGGQIPISALEGSGQMFLGGAGGPGAGLRQSLFLNRPTLLPLARSAGMGLVGTPRASPPPGARGASPDSCSISPCSSPASFCSLGEASPPPLGGAMAE